jgi:pimeloyl-ACP methyl ester carboxylesterase
MRRLRIWVGVLVVAAVAALVPGSPVQASSTRVDRSFSVRSISDGATHTLRGFEVSPACAADTVILLQHGLSYTSEAWDVPGYSYARLLADAGYAVVAVDRLGYGRSPLDNGRKVSSLAHADMAAQLARQLGQTYEHVVLAGHSAGGEAVVAAAGLFDAPVDAVIPMGYHTFPDPQFLALDWVVGDQVRALLDDYEYFLGTPQHRAEMFYTADADPAVIAADTAAAVLTPSGEIQTLSLQPARIGSLLVDVPVLAQLAERDRLFPSAFASLWAAQFVSSPSVTVDIVPGAGHTYMLHHSGPAAAGRIADWLAGPAGLPGCNATARTAS